MVGPTTHIDFKAEEQKIWTVLEEVKDPEVPVLSIIDLGLVRNIQLTSPLSLASGETAERPGVKLTITPTYSGCPAMDLIQMGIRLKLLEKGYKNISIQQSLSPAW